MAAPAPGSPAAAPIAAPSAALSNPPTAPPIAVCLAVPPEAWRASSRHSASHQGSQKAPEVKPRTNPEVALDVAGAEAVRIRWTDPYVADPRVVPVAGAVDDDAARRDVCAVVARRVVDVDDLGCRVVDADEGHVVE